MSIENLSSISGVHSHREAATQSFVFNHTMLRVKDITKSLDFYTRVLGFSLVDCLEFPEAKFSLYFLAMVEPEQIPRDLGERHEWMKSLPGVLELTHNHGTETDPEFAYHNGNSGPRGFGHICISVPDLVSACARFETLEVKFQKRLTEGQMKNVAFIKDPDDYWIEVLQSKKFA